MLPDTVLPTFVSVTVQKGPKFFLISPSHADSTLLASAVEQTRSKRTAVTEMYFAAAFMGLTPELSGAKGVRLDE